MENGQPGRSSIDQLQVMQNVVLEHAGRVFAEANRGADKDRATAAASRMRSMLPLANENFHNSLDDLEYELRIARWTLRRDLLRLRESQAVASKEANSAPAVGNASKDVEMQDAPTGDLPDAVALQQNQPATATESAEESKDVPSLQIDTTAQAPKGTSPDPPDAATAGMNSVDFDSLFNDPDSVTGSPPPQDKPTAAPPTAATATAKTEPAKEPGKPVPSPPPAAHPSLGPSEDQSVSALLPGLESYANAANDESNAIDLSTPVASKQDGKSAQAPATEQQQQQPKKQEQSQEEQPPQSATSAQRDTTFDDLMNFGDFDMGAFGEGTFEGDGGGESTFDDNFFNLE